jgi:LmbE family N-acetylglucosaminyl deacetylase
MNPKITRTLSTLVFVALLLTAPRAQQPASSSQQSTEDRIALYQALLDLTNPWTVMCVAAHPDDEDGTSLIVMRRKYGAHTVSLFSTFGEGGQNAIGSELYEELGAIRARETMAAAEIQGSEPHFLGLKDFGYSKSADEAFKFWGHEEALRRMVLEIRRLRPDVIITNHSVTSNDHGHHQATARLVVEAFDAAADPKRFPEQLTNGLATWQVQRLFVRARGNAQAQPDAQIVTIDPNDRDPVRSTMFAEQALTALQQHATQGPWPKTFADFTARFRAFSGQGGATGQMPLIRYRLERNAKNAETLPADSHNFVDGLKLTETEASEVSAPKIDGRPLTDFVDQPARIIDALEVSWKATQRFLGFNPNDVPQDKFRMSLFVHRTNLALAAAHGITTSLVGPDVLNPGASATFTLVVSNHAREPITLAKKNLSTSGPNDIGLACCPALASNAVVRPGQSVQIPLNYSLPADARMTVPHSAHLYDDRVFGTAVNTSVEATASSWFWVGARKWVDVAPPVEVKGPEIFVTTPQTTGRRFTLLITNRQHETFSGRVVPKVVPECESIACKEWAFEEGLRLQRLISRSFTLAPAETMTIEMSIPLASLTSRQHGSSSTGFPYKVRFQTVRRSSEIAGESTPIILGYSNAQVPRGLRIGYVRGFDYSLPNALTALGVASKELTVEEVKTADLSKFTSIIVDNRVYESKPELIAANQKLLDYANAGGNLIVFYHKSDEWNPDSRRNRPQLAPYKLILGNERITDENAPITFIEPDHPLLNVPNKMGQEDFKDWIQERGLYYPREWDLQFHAPLQSNDPNEQPLKGGLLVADYGKGHYIYTSMVWYRQLRAGVPGAYRMLANMISYGHEK